jgi:hypothetical protein
MWKQFSMWRARLLVLILLGAGLGLMSWMGSTEAAPITSERVSEQNDNSPFTAVLTPSAYLPIVIKTDPCRVSTGETYGSLTVNDWESSPPAETHPDINLAVRGYTPTNYLLGLIDLGSSWTENPPQLAGLFAPPRAPNIVQNYQVYGWDWGCNCRIGPISPPGDPEVTLIDLAATAGELVYLPDRQGGELDVSGYKALVLYVGDDRITLKYTRDDHVIWGYTLHVENVCVDSNLAALYTTLNNAGRHSLPALRPGQAFGRARSNRVGVVTRDVGTFMDPRSRNDWWRDY